MLTEAVQHLVSDLLWEYAVERIIIQTGSTWSRKSLYTAIKKVHHASACTPVMKMLIFREMQQYLQDGYNIIFPAADAVWVFGENIKLSRIAAVPKAY